MSQSPRRGQTTLDFAIGISLFLVVLVFVFSFVPGMLEPFETAGDGTAVVADRVGDGLAQGQLGHPAEPFVLDRDCTVEFFNDSRYENDLGSPGGCRYDGNAVHDRIGIRDRASVNVTLAGNASAGVDGSSTLCWDASSDTLAQVGSGDCAGDVRLTTGTSPPANNDVTVTARRVVYLADEDVTMKVVVW